MGYYPHGSHAFSDLVHYVRTADFIRALLRDSQTLDEYAFALGALSHYASDNDGHSVAVNLAVPMLYPRLKQKYGDVVTYDENPVDHLKTEFGFDVLEVAKRATPPTRITDFIGFQVAKPLPSARSLSPTEFRSIRCSAIRTKPLARIATTEQDNSPRDESRLATEESRHRENPPTLTRQKFVYHLSRASFNKDWGKTYEAPSFGEKFLAFLYLFIPKIGPLKTLQFKTPTPQTETCSWPASTPPSTAMAAN